jgi:hypothetical protein
MRRIRSGEAEAEAEAESESESESPSSWPDEKVKKASIRIDFVFVFGAPVDT